MTHFMAEMTIYLIIPIVLFALGFYLLALSQDKVTELAVYCKHSSINPAFFWLTCSMSISNRPPVANSNREGGEIKVFKQCIQVNFVKKALDSKTRAKCM